MLVVGVVVGDVVEGDVSDVENPLIEGDEIALVVDVGRESVVPVDVVPEADATVVSDRESEVGKLENDSEKVGLKEEKSEESSEVTEAPREDSREESAESADEKPPVGSESEVGKEKVGRTVSVPLGSVTVVCGLRTMTKQKLKHENMKN